MWCWVREALRWELSPASLDEFVSENIGTPGTSRGRVLLFLLAGISWVMWKARNDLVFSNILVSNPNILAHRIVGFLQHWCKMKSPKDQEGRERMVDRLQRGLRML